MKLMGMKTNPALIASHEVIVDRVARFKEIRSL
jgi:hypothetical protein